MRKAYSEKLEQGRVRKGEYRSEPGERDGAFFIRLNRCDHPLKILASQGDDEIPWEHVSVSTPRRCPTWDEMCLVKELFFEPEELVIQIHPRRSEYVTFHPFCLHLWKPIGVELPRPPMIAVGPPPSER